MRAAIYARYSDPRQNPASIRDQIDVCRALIAREGYEEVEVYADAAISAAATGNRPSFLQLMADAKRGRFDVVVIEALDRFSRGMADVSGAFEDLQAYGVVMHTVAEGVLSELHIGLKGTMNALFLKDLGAKTHRGMAGVLSDGRALVTPYGYRVVRKLSDNGELVVGLREIDEIHAPIVRRIFSDYAAGKSARSIAVTLNAEGVPSPNGGAWAATTLQQGRAGMLRNEVYHGVIVWGRTRNVKDRATGKRRWVIADPSKIIRVDRPELRLVDEVTWAKVQARLADHSAATPARAQAQRRPKSLLSGMIRCGCCGSAMILSGAEEKDGVRTARFRCRGKVTKGPAFCTNGGTIPQADGERRVLAIVRDRLLRPEMIEAVVREVHRLSAERARTAGADRGLLDRELAEVRRKAERLVDQVADGVLSGSTVASKIRDLETRATALERQLATLGQGRNVVAMIPTAADHYRRMVEDLARAIDGDTASEVAARETFQRLVGEVRMIPAGRGKYELEVVGHIHNVMALIAGDLGQAETQDRAGEFRLRG